MRFPALVFLSLFISLSLFAQWHSIGNVDSFDRNENELTIRSGSAILKISILASDLARIRLSHTGMFQPDMSWAVVKTEWPKTRIRITETTEVITATTDEMSIVIRKNPIRINFANRAGIINADDTAKGMSWNEHEVRVWKQMPEEEFYYGLGEKAGKLQRKWSHTTMWNSDIPAYAADTDPLYQTIPFFYGIKKGRAYGIFFDNSYWSSFDFGKESRGQYSFGAENGEINYYFFSGPSPAKILTRFTELVGRMPIPPRWSLGYQQCRWSYAPERRVREIAKGFRDRHIPCDVIYLDIDYMEGYRIFTWNPTNFPDPKKMISDLSKAGFKIAVIVDPGIKADTVYHAYRSGLSGNHFVKSPDGTTYIGKVWPGECAFPDFTSASSRQWWGENFSGLVNAGVRGWWNDMNEPSVFDVPTKTIDLNVIHNDNGLMTTHAKSHNIYGMQMTRATYDGVHALLPNERPFVLTRASYAGGHRYSAAWTGDNVASWDHLKMAVSMCLSMSISGQPFVGSDIGGFIGYPSGELFARWLQLGVFTPLMRAHSVINEKNKEPWEYGDDFTSINRETINLRYQFLPYIYTTMEQASRTGIPPMRPMIFAFPDEREFLWNDDQFIFGDDLLIAPVLSDGARTRELRLPKGVWYDYWTGFRHEGGRNITVDAPLNQIPLFVRAGAIIPTQQVVQYTDQAPIDPLTIAVYPSALQSTSTYYEDDGHTFEYEHGAFLRRALNQWNSEEAITFTMSKPEGKYVPPKRSVVVRFKHFKTTPQSVELSGKKLGETSYETLTGMKEGWTYQSDEATVWVKFIENLNEQQIIVRR
ncbi:MAG: Alpha-glucosidase [Bacteroidetes bacterium]|nr:Alpha-glucosidase [Bacteroidota bacterium]